MKPETPEIVDEIAVRMELVNACAEFGGRAEFAAYHALSVSYVDDAIRGHRAPTADILGILGFSKVTRYVKRSLPDSRAHILPVTNSGVHIPVSSSS